MFRRFGVGLLALGLVCAGVFNRADAGPRTAQKVRDDGGFFSPEAIAKANAIVAEISNRFKKDLTIETFKVAADKDIEAWTKDRYEATRTDGVYVLICREPSKLRASVGRQAARQFSDAQRDKLTDMMLAKFRAKDYDNALIEGATFVRDTLAAATGRPASQAPASAPATTPGRAANKDASPWGAIIAILVIALGAWLIFGLIKAMSSGGGNFMTGMLGGLFGAAMGMWMYNQFFGDHSNWGGDGGGGGDYGGSGGGDYGGSGGGDFGGGGGGGGDF